MLTDSGPSHWHPTEANTSLQFEVLVVPGRFITFGRRFQTTQLRGGPVLLNTGYLRKHWSCRWAGKLYRNKVTIH